MSTESVVGGFAPSMIGAFGSGTVACEVLGDFIRKRRCACEPPAELFNEALESLLSNRLCGLLL